MVQPPDLHLQMDWCKQSSRRNRSSVVSKARQILAEETLSPQKRRLLIYLMENPNGCYTDELARKCGVAFPPNRLGELNQTTLPLYGLRAECRPPKKKRTNGFGGTSNIHIWQLVMAP